MSRHRVFFVGLLLGINLGTAGTYFLWSLK